MTTFKTSIEIKATADEVFKALSAFDSYKNWHPSVEKIKGIPALDEWLVVFLIVGKRVVGIPAKVTVFDANKKMEWQGSLVRKGFLRKIFLVRHTFCIRELENGKVEFTNEEEFSPLLSLFVGSVSKKLNKGYEQVNNALKNRCEE